MYLGQIDDPLSSGTLVVNVSDIPLVEPSQLPPTLPVSVPAPSISPPVMASTFPWWILVLLGLAFMVRTKGK